MRNHEVTFIVDPVLSGDEIKATAKTYNDMLVSGEATIVNTDEMGLRQLAYPIKKRTTGIYYCVEFTQKSPDLINKMELAMRRDERIMRFLTVALDKYGIKYNQDKRDGKIGKAKKKISKTAQAAKANEPAKKAAPKPAPKPVAAAPKPVPAPAPVAVAAKEEEE